MTDNLIKAKEILKSDRLTCVLFDGKNICRSKKRGVKPLLEFLESDCNFCSYCAADKVVGAGAAHLYVLLGVKSVWAKIISESAKQILTKNNIDIFFETSVPHIINRNGDGICPIESCVKNIENSNEAFRIIKAKLSELA